MDVRTMSCSISSISSLARSCSIFSPVSFVPLRDHRAEVSHV